ncbi:MAG: NAD(P)H-hydrate dehydratase [Bacteroidetes bacterium]|jgi:NAD(P)H-hydrate epimerase|nr:NAD(P)H-hydrate dehydratase [Bacteroidota bacterium]
MSIYSPKNRFLRLCTAGQSRQLDDDTIHSFGLDGSILMEVAGLKAADLIRQRTRANAHGLFVCGKGNNAGDAFVIARYLADQPGHTITIVLAAGDEGLSPDAERNLGLLRTLSEQNAGIQFTDAAEPELYNSVDYIVDGMIGTGLSSDVREPLLGCIKRVNSSPAQTFSLDIPTGLHCDDGQVLGDCIHADHTITFGTNKIGFYLESGPDMCGDIHLAELPFPKHLRSHSGILIRPELLNETPEPKSPHKAEHKYQKGAVHIIAGSEGMTGAAIMAARSAWKAGAGAVFLYAPHKLLPIYEQTLPEIIKVPVGTADSHSFNPDHSRSVLKKIEEKPGVVLAGPGIGRSEETLQFIQEVVSRLDQPLLLDADALSGWKALASLDKSSWTITPHIGELRNAVGLSFKTDADRLREVRELAETEGCTVLSKGYPAFLAEPGREFFCTGYDTRLFAKAGFGDVLAGTIAGKMTVSKQKTDSIITAMLDIYTIASHFPDPEPRDIYDR